jgi:hypothetical protein
VIDALVVVVLVALGALAVYGVVITLLNRPPDVWTQPAGGVALLMLLAHAANPALQVLVGA